MATTPSVKESFSPNTGRREPTTQNEPDDELKKFNDKYHHSQEDVGVEQNAERNARRRRLLKRRIREEKLKAMLPKPWKLANPGPIGLLGFGMTTVLLNLHNTGHWPLYSVIPAMGICYGGGAQLIAGLLEFCRGNTFGCIAFTSYGAFWLSLVCLWMLPNSTINPANPVVSSSAYFTGVYLIVWGLFSTLMLCCTIRMNLAIFLVFLSVVILFFLLGGANMAGNATAVKAAGYEGIVCGSLALYLAFAEIINEVWDRTILPIVPFTALWAKCESKDKKENKEEDKSSQV